MRVKELMKFPKIRKLLEDNWANNEISGIFGEDSMSDDLVDGFTWRTSVVKLPLEVEFRDWGAHIFWDDLRCLGENRVRETYPLLFEGEPLLKGFRVINGVECPLPIKNIEDTYYSAVLYCISPIHERGYQVYLKAKTPDCIINSGLAFGSLEDCLITLNALKAGE